LHRSRRAATLRAIRSGPCGGKSTGPSATVRPIERGTTLLTETGSALRATSDALLSDLEALDTLEREKRELEPGDPRLVDLAQAVEQLARRLLGRSVTQRELSVVAQDLAKQDSRETPASIADTRREIHLILADWREAERQASETPPGSPDRVAADIRVQALRDEYREAHEAAKRRRP
jgi:hypothetical protein